MKNKLILVTGGCGFIGSHMSRLLLKKGFNVVIFDNLEKGSIEVIKKLRAEKPKGKLYFEKVDLRNKELLEISIKKYKIDAIIHFAAFIEAGESMKFPLRFFENNFNGSINLFSLAIKYKILKIIFSSTAAVYGEINLNPIKEDSVLLPVNYYGQSKLFVEKVLESLKVEGMQSIRFRYFNAAGNSKDCYIGLTNKNPSHLIPRVVQYALGLRTDFKLYGNDYETKDGTCVRDYIDVNDLTEAHYLGLKKLFSLKPDEKYTEVFNLGTGKGTSNLEIIGIIERIIGKKLVYETVEKREGDPAKLIADSTKAFTKLGWKSKVSIDNTIEEVVKWYKKINK